MLQEQSHGGAVFLHAVPLRVQDQADPMSGMSLLAGKALSSARMSDILSQTSLTGSQQLHQREESGQFASLARLQIAPVRHCVDAPGQRRLTDVCVSLPIRSV